MVFVQLAVLSTLWCSSYAIKTLSDQDAANADAVAKCYSGPEQSVWELVMGKQIDIGGASSTLELAQRAHVGARDEGSWAEQQQWWRHARLGPPRRSGPPWSEWNSLSPWWRLAGRGQRRRGSVTRSSSSTRTLWRMGSRILVQIGCLGLGCVHYIFSTPHSLLQSKVWVLYINLLVLGLKDSQLLEDVANWLRIFLETKDPSPKPETVAVLNFVGPQWPPSPLRHHSSKDASADFVYSKDAWCYMPDKQQIIDQAARIVKPGGKVMFTDWNRGWRSIRPWGAEILEPDDIPCHPHCGGVCTNAEEGRLLRLRSQRTVVASHLPWTAMCTCWSGKHCTMPRNCWDGMKRPMRNWSLTLSSWPNWLKKARSFRECLWAARKTCKREMWVVVVHRFAPSQARHFLQSSLQDLARVYFEYIL